MKPFIPVTATAVLAISALLLVPSTRVQGQSAAPKLANMAPFPNPGGIGRTYTQLGDIDLKGPFFQSLGTNGRSCATCHQPSDAMSVSAAHVQQRFDASQGSDPIFRTNDGANCDHDIDTSNLQGRNAAYSLLRTRGLFRVAVNVPEQRDYEIVSVVNPYGCRELNVISTYRRPLPSSNLKFLSVVMWDGRESSAETGTTPINSANYPQSLLNNLAHQAVDATLGHAQGSGTGLTAAQRQAIVDFEMSLSTAQSESATIGALDSEKATGGPLALNAQLFHIGINDPVGLDPENPTPFQFSTDIFNLFSAWKNSANVYRQAVARGQDVFNRKTFRISGVAGLNGTRFSNGVTVPSEVVSTCGICHDAPNAGNHSVAAPLDIGVSDVPGGRNVLSTAYLPVITVCRKPSLRSCVQTTDPGRALITGKFADVAKFKGPVLRGLAARAPYFHNGSAQSLLDVINFYEARFQIGLTPQEKSDLVAFLNSL